MKTMKHTGKKVLSVFLAVLMVMTAWVFVAPTEAQAAATYPVTVKFNNPSSNPSGHMKVYYFNVNSDGSVDTSNTSQNTIIINSLSGDGYGAAGNQSAGPFNIPGWPWKVEVRAERGTTVRFLGFYVGNIEVTGMVANNNEGYNVKGAITKSWAYNDNTNLSSGSIAKKNWEFPAVSSVRSAPTAQTITVPKSGSASKTFTATFNDQYGMQWPSSNGMSVALSPDFDGASATISGNTATVTGNMNVFNNAGYNSSNGQIKTILQMTLGGKTASCDVTFQAPKYNVYLQNFAGNTVKTYSNIGYYKQSVTLTDLPANTATAQIAGNETYHQPYQWPATINNAFNITGDTTFNEVKSNLEAHSYDNNWTQNENDHTRTCTVCSYVQRQEHIKGTGYVTKEETCTEDGVMTYDCAVCGKKTIETSGINNITGHNFSEIVIKEEGENGSHWKKCSRCDAYGWSGVENACENHNWDKDKDGTVDASDAIETKASTCKEAGYEKYKCTVCNATWTKTLDFAAHKTIATAAKDVTTVCGGDGNKAFWSCSVCNKVWKDAALTDELADTTDADNDGIPDALETKGPGHDFTGAYVSASAGEDGTHHRQCKRFTQCGAYGPEEPHTWGNPTVTPATCEKAGKKVYTCTSGCGQTYEEVIKKAAHSMTKIEAVAPKCGTPGNNEYYSCSTCGKYYKEEAGTTVTTVEAEKIAALEHKWTVHHDYDTLNTAADCQNAAVYNNHCDYCKVLLTGATHYYGDPDTVNGHKFNGETQKNADGTHSYKCTVEGCPDYGNATNCTYEVTEDVASTCKTAGHTTYTCTTCGNGYSEIKATDPNNHTGEGTYIIGDQEPTCAVNGSTGIEKCSGCNTILSTKLNDLPLNPNNHENMIDYNGQEATCQTEGWKAYKYCTACQTYEIAKETIAKKAHKFTTYNSNGDGTHTATCDTCDATVATPATETGTCSGGTANCVDKAVCAVCSGAYGDVDSANHETVVIKAKVPATCQTEGTEAYRYCEACDTALETPVTIEKKAHTYSAWTKIAGEDKHTRSCTTCDAAVAEVATETAPCSGGVANCVELATCVTCKGKYGSTNPDVHKTEANHLVDKKDATCQAPGYTGDYLYDCCNALKEEGTAIAQLAHTFSIEVEGTKVAATCIAKGEVIYKCSTCVESEGVTAATQKKELPIDAKNHASEETITVNAKAATCESDGHTGDVYYSCCYDSTKTEAENRKALKEKGTVIKANGQHIYGEAVPEYLIEAIKEVKDDEGKISKEFDLKDADALTYDEMIAARRDDDKWYHAQICTICDEVTYDACYTYAHTSNCVETDTCEECGGLCSLKSPLDHKGTLTYVEKVPATCSVDGVKAHYVCSVCGEKFSDALGKKPVSDDDLKIDSAGGSHDIDYESAKPIGDGKHEYGCTRCSAKIEEECDGGTDYCNAKAKCEICGQEYGEIDETNHASTEVTLVGRVEATCSEDGYEGDEYYECCYDENKTKEENQKALKKEGKVIPSKPELHVIAYKDIEGDTHTAYCTACEGAENAYSETVAHEWVAGETPELESCTDEVVITSTCVCGKTKTETIVGEHDFEITVETKAATCSEAGYKKTFKACKKCNYSEELPEEILEKLPHNIVTEEAVKPTCDGVGKHAYTYCKNPGCPYGYKKDLFIGSLAGYEAYKNNDGKTVDKLGHQDKDNNGSCDNCYNPLKENIDGTRCNCICHKQNVFMKFLYKILQFFWKLFKIEQTCGCGTKHW